jgi:GPH family glycoside/pentoside/hexuronide:cation symporter
MKNAEKSAADMYAEKLGFKDYMTFGFGDVAINFTFASLGMFVVYFYTDVAEIAAGIVGTLMLFSRAFDGVIDMVVGGLVDKTHSRWGKTRPWLLFGCLPFAILTVALFAVQPNWSTTTKVIYAFVSYNLLMVAFSSIAIPYGTLNSLVTRDQHQREKFNVFRMFEAQIGVLIVTNLTMPMVKAFGNKQSSWVATYAILSAVSVILLLIVFKTQKERVQETKKVNIPLKQALRAIAHNDLWWIATIFFIVYSIGYALNQGTTIYYAKYILHNSSYVGILTVAYLVPVLVCFLFMTPILKKYGKTKSMIVGSIISIVGYLFTLIDPSSFTIVMLAQVIKGIGQAPLLGSVWALFPDTIEYGEWKTHTRVESLLYSGGSLGQKVGVGLGTAITGWVLAWGHYSETTVAQPQSAITAIYALFIYIPILIFIIQLIFLYFYKMDKIYPRVMADLRVRKSQVTKKEQ